MSGRDDWNFIVNQVCTNLQARKRVHERIVARSSQLLSNGSDDPMAQRMREVAQGRHDRAAALVTKQQECIACSEALGYDELSAENQGLVDRLIAACTDRFLLRKIVMKWDEINLTRLVGRLEEAMALCENDAQRRVMSSVILTELNL